MVKLSEFVVNTVKYTAYINITEKVREIVENSGVQNGVAMIITAHTTTGITVNEALECLQSDMEEMMRELVPEYKPYSHARMLHSYGQTAGNPTGHLRSMLTNNHTVLPVKDGKLYCGKAQEIFLAEYDGPQNRRIFVEVIGE
ncbi:MAG: YjbQ family protein [Clostridiales bacterium]|jgi:secondary thiamine-phosphate synthase enzyme|nr:YjbQ family protein [Clostridiales bacterium]OPZ70268.1 MAG: hypothetical protein BWY81_00017 [Firmicutes bacterium ADurb.Bin467]